MSVVFSIQLLDSARHAFDAVDEVAAQVGRFTRDV